MKIKKSLLLIPGVIFPALAITPLLSSCSNDQTFSENFKYNKNEADGLAQPEKEPKDFRNKSREDQIKYFNDDLTIGGLSDDLIYTMRHWITFSLFSDEQCKTTPAWDKYDSTVDTVMYKNKADNKTYFSFNCTINLNEPSLILGTLDSTLEGLVDKKQDERINQIKVQTKFETQSNPEIKPSLTISDLGRNESYPLNRTYQIIKPANEFTSISISTWHTSATSPRREVNLDQFILYNYTRQNLVFKNAE